MVSCAECGTPLMHIDEACPNCLAGSGMTDRPPTGSYARISELEAEVERLENLNKDWSLAVTTAGAHQSRAERDYAALAGVAEMMANDLRCYVKHSQALAAYDELMKESGEQATPD